MSPSVSRSHRSHTYTFTLYGSIGIDEVITELQQAKAALGGSPKVSFKSYDGGQRDGYSCTVTVHS